MDRDLSGSPSPLSHGQRSLWFLHQLAPEAGVYNIAAAARVRSPVDEGALERAFQALVDRHGALRTTFPATAGEPCRRVAGRLDFALSREDAAGWGEERLRERLAAEAWRPFDLESGPLLRVTLFTGAPGGPVLLVVIHHIIADFWSLAIVMRELPALYRGDDLAPPGHGYDEHVRLEREALSDGRGEPVLAWWRERLAGLPTLELPTDRPRPAVQTYRGDTHRLRLPGELAAALRARSRAQHGTLFMTLAAAFQTLLGRHADQEDLAIGTARSGRTQAQAAGTVGYFVNQVVLRGDLAGDPAFAELLERTKTMVQAAFAHGDYPLPLLAEHLQPERDASRTPLFQVSFVLQKETRGAEGLTAFALGEEGVVVGPEDFRLESMSPPQPPSPFDLVLHCVDRQGGLSLALQYNTDLFDAATTALLLERFERLLEGVAADPRQRLSELPLLSAAERAQLLDEWSGAAVPYPREAAIQELFAEQAALRPEAVAVESAEESLTYKELKQRAGALARWLRGAGVGPEVRVGVCLDRSAERVVATLAVLEAGGAYVPLDPAYPEERLRFLLADAGVRVALVHEPTRARLAALAGESGCLLLDCKDVKDFKDSKGEVFLESLQTLPSLGGGPTLAYVMYTSGSTGKPKGVVATHRGVVRLVRETGYVRFGPDEVFLQLAPYAFDASTFEIWGALLHGGRLVMPPPGALSPAELGALVERHGVTTLWLTTGLFHQVVEEGLPGLAGVRQVMTGGDVISVPHVRRTLAALPATRLTVFYGPTENTTFTTSFPVIGPEDVEPSVPLGGPIANSSVYVLDRHLAPVPAGVAGELFTGGDGLARGYLDRPELTAERFVPDPFGREPGGRLYRTGDRVRWQPTGTLEFLGRIDTQVKVRGFRVEPGEIETALRSHPWVREAVVLAERESSGNQRLVAYVAGDVGEAPGPVELRGFLRQRMPEFMLPAAFAFLPALPLTAHAKFDRKALAKIRPERAEEGTGGRAPRTPAEELLAEIFAEVLKRPRVGADESFFDLGGHSLLATQVTSRVRTVFGVELPLRALFEAPTVEGLAGWLERSARDAGPAIVPIVPLVRRSRDEPPALSFAQQRLWFLDQLEPGSPVYNIPAAVELAGRLDRTALAAALGEVVGRHEALRTVFAAVEGEPVQVVGEPAGLAVPLVDLRHLLAPESAVEASRLAAAEARRPFDLGRGPLLRTALLRTADERHVLLLTMHHIVSDGWSLGVLVRELGVLYAAFHEGRPSPLPELAIQYADFAAWQRRHLAGERLEMELAWWRGRLAGMPPAVELPADFPRPAVRGTRGAVLGFAIERADLDGLAALSRRQGATLFMTLLAGFFGLLQRFTGEDDLGVGTPIAGRTRVETEPLIGLFVNTLVLRGDLSGEPSLGELLARVRETTLAAYAHQEVPFERLVEELVPRRDPSRPPLVQVLFALQNAPAAPLDLSSGQLLPGLALTASGVETGTARLELSCTLTETERGLEGLLEYGRDLYDRTTAQRLADGFARLLAAVVATPEARVRELPVLAPAERAALLVEWNDTAAPPRREPLVHELVLEQARQRPEALAVAAPGERLTYGELAARARSLATILGRLGVGPEARVALCAGGTVHRVVGSLAVLLAGGAYVLLDPEASPERLAFQIADSGAAAVLAERLLAGRFQGCAAPVVALEEAGEEGGFVPASSVGPENLAYVVYTSGSTGQPKGVAIPHAGLLNLVRWHVETYGLGPSDRALLIANPAFDASVFELWPCLATGASVHIPAEETRLAPQAIVRFWRSAGITWSFLPTPLAEEVIAEPSACAGLSLRGLWCGGDRLHRPPPAGLPFTVFNLYGPSEVSVASTGMAVPPETPGAPPIGRPILNLRTRVVDAGGALAPRGVAGELWMGGAGLARGYLGRPALTAERFLPDPWSGAAGERLYRTGDLVRHRPGGSLEFLGRVDHQIKLRGFRIEPGEIEAVLREHPEVSEAVVAVVPPGRLVAWVVGAAPAEELRELLRERLPAYMVPAAFVLLDTLPLTPNGKLDRKALPAPAAEAGEESAAPRTVAEERVAAIFAEVLGRERVGLREDFFALGGHSLLATRVASRVRSVFGVELPVRVVFEAPTVESLAAWLERAAPGEVSRMQARAAVREEDLSFAQQRLWFLDQLDPGSPLYNIAVAVELRGRLDTAALAAALGEIVRRHEALRTTFRRIEERPVQVVRESAGFAFPRVDLAGLPELERAAEVERLAQAEARQPFDLREGPLLRAALLRTDGEGHTLLVTMHHIVSDGWSLGVLVRELEALYPAFLEGRPSPLPDLALQYVDFTAWQRRHLTGELLASEVAWWREHLAGMPPALDLPTDHPRPAVRSARGAVREVSIDGPLIAGLTALSQRHGATLFMALLAGLGAFLRRVTGAEDLAVGTPIAGRTRDETEALIGFFVNTLALRVDLSGSPGFLELLGRVRETTLAAYAHQELPFERLVEELAPERDRSRPPIFQVMLGLQNAPLGPPVLPGLALRTEPVLTGTAKFELTFAFTEGPGGLAGTIEYSRDLFEATTIDRWAGQLLRLLAGAVADPSRQVPDLPFLGEAEIQQALVEWNDTTSVYPRDASLPELFAAVAAALPDAPAIVAGAEVWSYRRLDEASSRLARHLQELGVVPQEPVGVALERSPELIVGVLAILKAGGVYVPLDPGFPEERLRFLLADAGVRVVVAPSHRPGEGETGCVFVDVGLWQSPPLPVDGWGWERGLGGEGLAYLIYTSGSTGRPKGVAVPHRAVVRLVRETGYVRLGPGDRVGHAANVSFDAATWEIWGALLNGAAIVVIPREAVLSPAALAAVLRERQVTSLFLTTALFTRISREMPDAFAGLRELLFGGEAADPAAARAVLAAGPPRRLLHVYGPTESTTYASWHPVREVPPGAATLPIGAPIGNTSLWVLDRALAPVPPGSAGELCIGGDGLALGYWNRPELTAERFVPSPWGNGERLYRTGDLVRRLPDGAIDFLGRLDGQVKIRGFRIEPGEIEAVLLEHPEVREVVVLARKEGKEGSGGQHLAAYVVLHRTDRTDPSDLSDPKSALRDFLRGRLPEFMLPAAWAFLPALPLTPSGKVDRRALGALEAAPAEGDTVARTPAEALLAGIFAEVLGVERVDLEADFFALGGHSLLATQVVSRIQAVLGVEPPLRTLFDAPTVRALAAWIERARDGRAEAGAGEAICRVARDEPLALSFAQQRLWFLDQLEPGSPLYNIPAAVAMTGRLDPAALAAAFGEVVRRHEALRTTFRPAAGEPVQVIAEPGGFALPLVDLQGLPARERDEETRRLGTAEARTPFDLGAGPLLRATLVRSAAEAHTVLLTMHHIVSDGWSLGVLVRELGALYAAQVDLEPAASPLPELPVQYADFAAWQRRHLAGDLLEAELAWWRGELAGMPPALELPADHPRPAERNVRGAVHAFAIEREGLDRLTELAQRHGATLFMTLLAGFAGLLQRATGEEDLVIGTPIAGRTRVETEPLIGFFVNALALRLDLAGTPVFAELLGRVRDTTLAAYAHQEVPFERLVEELAPERDRSRPPLFQVVLAFQNAGADRLALPGLDVEVSPLSTGTAKFELSLVLTETAEGLAGAIEHSRDLFDDPTIARLAGHFARLLAAAVADPFQPVRELPLLAEGERHQLLAEWNDTRVPFPETTLLHQFFEAAVERAPEAIAAACAGTELTYAGLDARSNRLAHLLREVGIERGAPVGVWVERSLDMLTAVLGVLKAGGHYVALDEAWPADRVESILAATGAPAIVAGAGLLGAVEEMRWRLPALSDVVCLAFSDPEPPAEAIDPESVRALWDFVAERAVDKVTAGGFVSALTCEPMSEAEVDEYRDRVLSLAGSWLRPDARVLEIGNGSGLLLWEMASRVDHVTGVDPSPLTQERNKQHAAQEGIANVELLTGFAHEVDGLLGVEERFDLILLASTVQFFPGPRYLERVMRQALGRLAPGGALLVADVLDARRREELRQVTDEHRRERGLEAAARRQELFLDEDLFRDLGGAVYHRTEGFANELGFRYDVLLTGEPAERRKRLWTGWHVDRRLSARLPQMAGPEDVAYVIHTSGSTGEPKGIVVQHRPAANLVDWINRTFEVGPADRGLFVTSLCFDLSVYDVFGLLAAGGTVHVATREELGDPDHLVRLLRTGGITLWDSAPAALLQLAPLFPAEPDAGSRLRRVLLSGDWIPVTLPDRVRQAFPGAAVMALGGATEATVWSNWFPVGVVDPVWPSIPYGRPMANARYHVLDEGLAPCPIGVPGDLYIGGDCLCVGYARRPELTAQAFLPDPFSVVPGARLYRTGDRARAFANGNLEFLGRLDQQVKVRGYRIELGEIEVALARHPQVREAVAMAREDEPGDKRLVAYVVLDPADSSDLRAELAAWLRARLPEYMIPSAFVTLPELPVTANGKLDRRALPAPEYSAGAGYVAARTPTEETLAAIWASLLGVPQVGREDGFFDLGGHSLLATQMLSRVREEFGVELSLRMLFDMPRLAELAAWIESSAGEEAGEEPIPRVPREAPLALSFAQQRLWFLDQLEPGSVVYNVPAAVELRGRLDAAALAAALGEVVRRHEVLRTSFPTVAGAPVQAIADGIGFALPWIDLTALPEREAESSRLASSEARRPFDLTRGPLLRTALLKLERERHVLLLALHHIVSDGWSVGVLVRELGALYASFLAGRPSPLPELPVQYADFAAWQRRHLSGALLEAEIAWWRERLAGSPPALDLPVDHPRPAEPSERGGLRGFAIDAAGLAGLAELSRRQGTTLFMTLLAGFAGLLQRCTGQDDLVVGTPIAGRTRTEIEPLIGFFVNTLALRVGLADSPRFLEILERVRETTLGAYAHQELPFERLVEELAPERDRSRPPIFQVLFTVQNEGDRLELPGLEVEVAPLPTGTAKLELSVALAETAQGLAGSIEFRRDLFDEPTIERVAGWLTRFLAEVVADPRRRLAEVVLLGEAERHQVLVEWNEVGTFTDGMLHGLFEAQVARTPEAVALVDGPTGERWTYRALDEWAGTLASELVGLGVGPEVRVAVQLQRTPLLVASLLAVLKAGGAYVPLDPTYPEERLAFLLEDSGAAVLITEEASSPTVETPRGASPPPGAAHSENLAYLIYTSGSTGRPKAVAIEHRSAVAFAHWARTIFTPEDFAGVLAATSVSFDLSVFEIFVTLAWGGKIILAANALELPRLPTASEVTLLNTVPSAMTELVRQRAVPPSVRTINLAGEPLKRSLVDAIYASTSAGRVLDLYGPSEDTTYSTWAPALRDERREPAIGRPIAGSWALLLGRSGELVPAGVAGELFLGGAGLARGYLGRPDLTAERFVPDPFGPESGGTPGGRLYRTGDLARALPDGRLDYLGRIDHQVKVRGFRIELGEIEAALLAQDQVREAAVLAREDEPGDKRLVAYVVFDPTDPADRTDLSDLESALAARLPAHMIPSAFVVLPALPLTPNGKLDRRALPAPQWSAGAGFAAPQTPVEEILAAIWSALLNVPRVGREDSFFALGGHSLLATRMASRVREICGVDLPLRTLFDKPKLADLARAVEAARSGDERPSGPAPRPAGGTEGGLPLSFAQERLWFLEQLEPGSATYNMPVAVELSGALEASALAEALAGVVRRQESLRTTFPVIDGAPRQRISAPSPALLPLVDLAAVPAPAAAAEADRLAREEARQGFDLERGPLLRGLLVRLSAERHHLLMTLHHIVSDGWSVGVLLGELGALYTALLDGRSSPLPELPVQYADFAVWQREQLAGKQTAQLAYWEDRLGGEVAAVELPTDRPRPAVQTFRGGRRDLVLSPELTARLHGFGRAEGATLFMTLLAATQTLLSRHSGERDVPVGAPVAGRQSSATEGLIGCFLNTLVLRTDLSGRPSFRELAARVRTVTLDAYGHQDVPFEAVLARLRLDRDLSRTPLFQVLFNLLNLPRPELSLPGLDLRILTPAEAPSKLDMTFYVSEAESRVWIHLVYNADLFDEARMADLLAQLELLLAQAVERPDEPVDHLSLVTDLARGLLPDPTAPLDAGWIGGVHELFALQAEAAPERPAVIGADGVVWSYGDLLAGSRGVAGWLAAQGVRRGDPVAILGHRSAPLVQAVQGVLTAGAAFLILDPAYPASRLAEMLRLAAPRAWIGLEAAGSLPEAVEAWLEAACCPRLVLPAGGRAALEHAAAFSREAPRVAAGPNDPACIGFTSGSTGGPKGILGLHGSLSHFLPAYCAELGLGPDDRFSLLSGLSHDPLQRDIFTALYLGAAIVVPDPEGFGIAGRLAEWMDRERVTVAHLTPALGQLVTARPAGAEAVEVRSLRRAILIGEALTRQDVERLHATAPGVACFNLYGATETQRALSFHRVPRDPARSRQVLPLGRGFRDAQLLVVNESGGLAGVGEVGEIVVRSPHLARGYLGDEAATAGRFRLNPFTGDEGDRIYRTGDLGRYLPDGEVAFAGRGDFQVKLRGFRIELAEIEAALARHPAVREAVVLLRDGLPGGSGLVAYVVPAAAELVDAARLHDHLWQRLPAYMVPAAFLFLESLPRTPTGKIDRRALARYELPDSGGAGGEPRALRTPVEEIVAGLWADVLGRDGFGPDDNFFQLGGHSLTGAQIVSRLREAFHVELPLRVLFEAPTLGALAAEVERRRRPDGAPERPSIAAFRQDRSAPPPLSFAQERFWAGRHAEARSVASTIPVLILLEGDLDLPCLHRALQEIVDRHEVLRTSFRDGSEGPVQVIHGALPVRLPIVDLEGLNRPEQRSEVQRWSTLDGRSPFDYERGPLFRMTLFRCSERENVVLFTIHHVAFDGWSRSVLVAEMAALYDAFHAGRPSPLRPLPAQYQDFSRWQRQVLQGEALERETAFWREHLRGASPVRLGGDRPRPAHPTFEAGFESFTIPEELERRLEAFAAKHNATLFMTMLAAFKALLHLESGKDDVVVTSLFANRNQVETEGLIGNFFAGLPLRTRFAGARTFRDLLERVRDETLLAHEHPDILYEPAMEGLSFLAPGERGGLATFRILFQLAKLPRAQQTLSDLQLVHLPFDTGKIRQDLSLFLAQSDRLGGRFKYNRDVLDHETVVRLRERFLEIIEVIVADPDCPLAGLLPERILQELET